ncbi:MAG: PQQ-dependent sugar dehydrogenase [Polyangiaceae bacterium]
MRLAPVFTGIVIVLAVGRGIAACGSTGLPASPVSTGEADATVGSYDASPRGVNEASSDADGGASDANSWADVPLNDAATLTQDAFCATPGSIIWTDAGPSRVPGGNPAMPDMAWLQVPPGFCTHFFATVHQTRQLRFAPGGDLFVASPGTFTAGGFHYAGRGEVDVLPDDDHDGVADDIIPFFPNKDAGQPSITATQGLMFANGYFYYEDIDPTQSDTFYIRRVPFKAGDRAPSAPVETVTTMSPRTTPPARYAADHWPKNLDIAQDGTIYVTNGSNQSQGCYSPSSPMSAPFGVVFKMASDGGLSVVSQGFRNPIALRCESKHNVCFAVELALDGSQGVGREKIVPVQQGADWGFPCCATTNTPYDQTLYFDTMETPDCGTVTRESVSFIVGHTPFGIDFEPDEWPAPWTGRLFTMLHGDVGSFEGARIVAIALDPTTGNLSPASELDASNANNMLDFATGWFDEDAGLSTNHGRPTAIAFAPDGRAFIGDDYEGLVAWIAPVTLTP